MEDEYVLSKVEKSDTKEIELLALMEGGNKRLTESFLEHWYFDNPSHSFSFWKVIIHTKIEGFATTNNFIYTINKDRVNVAMPQNVLTSQKVRGRGLFNKLYFKTEACNLNENNVAAFLTFTNALSTPIFLNKFNYEKGKCPLVIFSFFSFTALFKKKNFERLTSINEIEDIFFKEAYLFDNALQKNKGYYHWRYKEYAGNNLHIVKVFDKKNIIGYAFLKVEKKKGIKFLILMDIIVADSAFVIKVIESCFNYSATKFFTGTMVFDLPATKLNNKLFRLKISDRFNFLVKGKDEKHTQLLSNINFNMFFGDLDIV